MCTFILQGVQQEINKMIEEAATSESAEDANLSDDTVESRIQCSSVMKILRTIVVSGIRTSNTGWVILCQITKEL